MARGTAGDFVFAYATILNDAGKSRGIFEIDLQRRVFSHVPNTTALHSRQWNLTQAKIPWINWAELDPNPVRDTSGFGSEIPW